MNQVTLFDQPGLPIKESSGALRQLAMLRSQGTGKAFLKFGKDGRWVFGPEAIEVVKTEVWAVNPNSFCIGVIGWNNGQVVGEQMFPITSPQRVDQTKLTPIDSAKQGDGWKEQITVDLKNMEDGTEVIYKTTSRGGMNAMATLAQECADRLERDAVYCVPLVHLLSDFYMHKDYGKTYTPVLDVMGWADMNGKQENRPALV